MKLWLKNFKKDIVGGTLSLIWSQWSAAGVYAQTNPQDRAIVDPEALICATAYFGRYSQRVFDEALDWIAENEALVNIERLKRVASEFSEETRATIGVSWDFLGEGTGNRRIARVARNFEKHRPEGENNLFKRLDGKKPAQKEPFEEVFLTWGFRREKVELRKLSRHPDLGNPANLLFLLRALMGVGARADVVCHLMLGNKGNSMSIARDILYGQRQVYNVLKDLAKTGLVGTFEERGRTAYFTSEIKWGGFFGVRKMPRYVNWTRIYSALEFLAFDLEVNPHFYEERYLASSRFRDLTPAINKRLAISGIRLEAPNPERFTGEEYSAAFVDYIGNTVKSALAARY